MLNRLVFLSAEPSSYVGGDHAHLVRWKAERIRHVPPPVIDVLLPCEDQDDTVAVRREKDSPPSALSYRCFYADRSSAGTVSTMFVPCSISTR